MKLAASTVLLSLGGVPMVGNTATGGIIGLTPEGARLCRNLAEREVPVGAVPEGCHDLVEHLRSGGYLEESPSPRPRVSTAYLHVTQRCNLSCRFCYSEDTTRNRLDDPSIEELFHAIDLLTELGCSRLTISGGEPLLRDDLPEVAAHAKRGGMSQITVLTNGLLVSEKNVGALAEHVTRIAVAFDGASSDDPVFLRGSQRFDQLVSAVQTIKDAGIEACVLPTLHAGNLADMPRYRQLAQRLGATLSYSLLTANVCGLGDLVPSDRQLCELGRAAATEGLPGTDPADDAPPLSARNSCGAGARTLSVAADGTVYPCHMLHSRDLAMGNAFSDSASKITGSKVAGLFQNLGVKDIEGCSACAVRHLCGGGCRARAYLTTGALASKDPYCELSRSYYEAIGERLHQRFCRGGE